MANSQFYIGLMSGTSLDGIDCALVQIQNKQSVSMIGSACVELPNVLKQSLIRLSAQPDISVVELGLASRQIAELSAHVINEVLSHCNVSAEQVTAIGSHGVTIRHLPDLPMTLQIGDASLIAALTGIDVVGDFRSADLAAGGQGAPLVPAFHQAIFQSSKRNRVILNLGGIANITVLQSGKPIVGFDTGPANTLINTWCQRHTGLEFDGLGSWGRTGVLQLDLLDRMMSDNYFQLAPPKSTGKERFNLDWLDTHLATETTPESQQIAPADVQSTLTHLTAKSAAQAILSQLDEGELIVCGGGVHNQFLLECLQSYLPSFAIISSAECGVSPDDLEAIAFAWLAYCRIHEVPAGMPDCTGADRAKVLGAWHKAS